MKSWCLALLAATALAACKTEEPAPFAPRFDPPAPVDSGVDGGEDDEDARDGGPRRPGLDTRVDAGEDMPEPAQVDAAVMPPPEEPSPVEAGRCLTPEDRIDVGSFADYWVDLAPCNGVTGDYPDIELENAQCPREAVVQLDYTLCDDFEMYAEFRPLGEQGEPGERDHAGIRVETASAAFRTGNGIAVEGWNVEQPEECESDLAFWRGWTTEPTSCASEALNAVAADPEYPIGLWFTRQGSRLSVRTGPASPPLLQAYDVTGPLALRFYVGSDHEPHEHAARFKFLRLFRR
jgi:hypothetical protein